MPGSPAWSGGSREMAELLEAVVSWPSLLLVLVVFGFAPGFCRRLISSPALVATLAGTS